MTYPGAPGGYPGPGQPQPQPPQGFGPPPGPVGSKFTLAQTLHLVVIGLGALNLFLGFAPISAGYSFYESGFGWVTALLFAGGLLALPAVLAGDKKVGLPSVAVVLSATLAFLFTVFTFPGDLKAGGIMVLIFGLLQAIAAVVAYLFEAGVLKPPAPQQHHGHFGQPGGYNPPSGQFQQPGYGQPQPPVQPGSQTTFAPQQGQFGQPQQNPGTPPGGYPQ